jgi:hypothetical protein
VPDVGDDGEETVNIGGLEEGVGAGGAEIGKRRLVGHTPIGVPASDGDGS